MKIWKPELSNISSLAKIGENTIIHAGCHIHDHVEIGDRCQIQAMVFIPNGVTIEDDVFIGPGTIFTNDPTMDGVRETWKPTMTLICRSVRIGANCSIKAGITIHEDAKIGLGSVVLEDVPRREVWVGNPARKIR